MAVKPTKAMVLAAGYGKRMREYNSELPKPLVDVAGKKLIDWSLDLLAEGGIPEVVVNVSYLAEQVETHVKQRTRPIVHLSHERTPLETGGGVLQALPLLGDGPFFVLNSDVICRNGPITPLLERLANCWAADEMDALLLLVPVEKASGYRGRGDFFITPQGYLRRQSGNEDAPYIFSGIQLLHPRFFQNAPDARAFSMNVLYNAGKSADGVLSSRVRGLVHDGAWLHVGDGQGVREAEAQLLGMPLSPHI